MNYGNLGTTTWDMFKAHDNTLYVPVNSQADPYGADCFRWGGSGVSIYNNSISGYFNGYTGSQHQDGCQVMGGTDIKIYNNYFFQLGNSGCYISPAFQAQTYTYVYNNVVVACHDFGIYMDVESGDVSTTLANCLLANNIVEPVPSSAFGTFFGGFSGQTGSFANNIVANNIVINESSSQSYFGSTISQAGAATESDTVFLTTAQAASDFLANTTTSTNGNFHLTSAATALIGEGINLSSYFTIDKDENLRPATGAWDIGPFVYGATNTPVPPTLNALAAMFINENAGTQTVNLTGITSGSSNQVQTLTVTATSSSPSLIPNPTVNYKSQTTNGTLSFAPMANAIGSATITVTVNDGAASNNLTSQSFAVSVGLAGMKIRVMPSKQFVLTVTGTIGHIYNIQATQDFKTWTLIGTVTMGTNGSLKFTDTNAASFSRRFYRTQG